MPYNPFENEKTQYSLEAFIAVAKEELDKYQQEWQNANEFHKNPHTWNEWWKSFHRYMSW